MRICHYGGAWAAERATRYCVHRNCTVSAPGSHRLSTRLCTWDTLEANLEPPPVPKNARHLALQRIISIDGRVVHRSWPFGPVRCANSRMLQFEALDIAARIG